MRTQKSPPGGSANSSRHSGGAHCSAALPMSAGSCEASRLSAHTPYSAHSVFLRAS